ncbi:MAG TPA: radical SAM protein [Verrucomicrobiae bacterium]|nr:radical SAM protein [Verrucomicrobiae bacterium]
MVKRHANNTSEAEFREPAAKTRRLTLVPSACDVSVTNACNATCDFCSFARDKQLVKEKRWLNRADFARALPILYRRGIRYLTFQGGEPLLHREIDGLVADAAAAGIHAGVITNGWMLPQKIESLIRAGLRTLLVSIDSHSLEKHEENRGLQGVGERIRQGLSVARHNGVLRMASVTVSRLVQYEALPELLDYLGFDAVVFSYPRREPFGSTSMVFSQNSSLIDFGKEELCEALESIKALKKRFPVFNPAASIDDIKRHVRGEREHFACVGGYKYFYIDWNLNVWRCEAWNKPYGSVFDLDKIPDCRDRCTACMMSCYRDASVLMHAGMAFEDAMTAAGTGHLGEGTRLLFQRTVAQSLASVVAQSRQVFRLAGRPLKHSGKEQLSAV